MQKAERFFKERKISYQLVDLNKHVLGPREMDLFVKSVGITQLIDYENKKVKEHPLGHMNIESTMKEILMENPGFMISPIVRNGNKIALGEATDIWETWVKEKK